MANYKRKKPKLYRISSCGYKACKYDAYRGRGNNRERFVSTYWRDTKLGDQAHPWRYGIVAYD